MVRDVRDNMVTAATTILETLEIIDTHGVPIGLVHADGVELVMNAAPITADAKMTDTEAARIMRQHGIGHLPLVDQVGRIVGLKVLKDLDPKPEGGNPVVLMAGGRGTRLQPLTEDLPKPLLKVDGAVKSRFLMRVGWVIIVHVYFTRPTDRRIV